MKRRLLLLLAIASLCASTASAQTIGIFFDTEAASCSGTIPDGKTVRIYIIGILGGQFSPGITGVEFRVTGLPSGWLASATADPEAAIVLGNPFSGPGVNLAYSTCNTSPKIRLYTVDITATSPVSNAYLRVESRNPPLDPTHPCPLMVHCGFPFPFDCVPGGAAIINPTGPGCTVAVETTSWSRVKNLYD